MPADLTREEIERIRDGYAGVGWMPSHEVDALLRHVLSEPTRLASARQEGYREGIDSASRIAEEWRCQNCGSWLHPQDEVPCCTRPDWERQHTARELVELLVALSPAPAEPDTAHLGHTDLMVSPEAIERVLAAETADGPDNPYFAALNAWEKDGGPRPARRPDGVPTRADMQWMTPAELAIRDAMQAVEAVGASLALTDAMTLLGKAQERVADYVEGVEGPTEPGAPVAPDPEATARIAALEAESAKLRALLDAFDHCARLDVTMEGPRLIGWRHNELGVLHKRVHALLQGQGGPDAG